MSFLSVSRFSKMNIKNDARAGEREDGYGQARGRIRENGFFRTATANGMIETDGDGGGEVDKATVFDLMKTYGWLQEMLCRMPSDALERWELRRFVPQDSVCEQGGLPDEFFIVLEGRFKVEHRMEDGNSLIIAYLGPGQLISDIEIAIGQPYVCSIIAETAASALVLKAEFYLEWLRTDNRFLFYLTKQLAGKLYTTVHKSIDQVSMSLRHKLIRYLYNQVEHINFNQQVSVTLSIQREDLASQWGVTPRSVNRILKELKDRQIVYVHKNQIICNEWSRYLLKKELTDIEN